MEQRMLIMALEAMRLVGAGLYVHSQSLITMIDRGQIDPADVADFDQIRAHIDDLQNQFPQMFEQVPGLNDLF